MKTSSFAKFTLLLMIAVSLIAGCRTLPIENALPGGLVAARVADIADGGVFDLAPDGKVVALVDGGLQLLHLPTGDKLPVSEHIPVALAWSPYGYSLAALYDVGGKSRIAVYDQHGILLVEESVAERLTSLSWLSEVELVAGGFRVLNYKFGSNYRSLLYRWKPGRNRPAMTELRDTTLRLSTYEQWQAQLLRGPMLEAAGPSGQVLYLQPVDPPMFTPYYKMILRDLASGAEMETASVTFAAAGGKFSADGELLLYGDCNGKTFLGSPWSEVLVRSVQAAGSDPALAPDGRSWYADGALFGVDGSVTSLVNGGQARFTADGGSLLLRTGNQLYRVSGLPGGGAAPPVANAEKVQKLRELRLKGLLTAKEYKESLERLGK